MTFASFTNIVVAVLCTMVILQSIRMIRNVRAIQFGDLSETIRSLDHATAQARGVLRELKDVLTTDGAATIRTFTSGETLRDELSVMVGIGNAVADRIMDAASAGERRNAPEPEARAEAGAPASSAKRPRRRRPARKGGDIAPASADPTPAYASIQ